MPGYVFVLLTLYLLSTGGESVEPERSIKVSRETIKIGKFFKTST